MTGRWQRYGARLAQLDRRWIYLTLAVSVFRLKRGKR